MIELALIGALSHPVIIELVYDLHQPSKLLSGRNIGVASEKVLRKLISYLSLSAF